MGCVQFGIEEFIPTKVLMSVDDVCLKYVVEARRRPSVCAKCGVKGHLSIHSSKKRLIHDLPLSGKQVLLEVKVRRFKCSACGQTFVESFGSIDNSQLTKRLRDEIVHRVLRRETFTKIANDYSISDKTVRREFDKWAVEHSYLLDYEAPRILGSSTNPRNR